MLRRRASNLKPSKYSYLTFIQHSPPHSSIPSFLMQNLIWSVKVVTMAEPAFFFQKLEKGFPPTALLIFQKVVQTSAHKTHSTPFKVLLCKNLKIFEDFEDLSYLLIFFFTMCYTCFNSWAPRGLGSPCASHTDHPSRARWSESSFVKLLSERDYVFGCLWP